VCSMGRAGGGARAAPVSATGRRAGGRFDVDRVGGHDKMHRTHPPAVAQARILPSGPAPHPGGRERVFICSSACFQSPEVREDRIRSARLFQPPSYCSDTTARSD